MGELLEKPRKPKHEEIVAAAKQLDSIREQHPDELVRRLAYELQNSFRIVTEKTTWAFPDEPDLEDVAELIRKDLGVE